MTGMTPERLAEIRARAEVGTGVFHFTCPSCGSAPGVRCYGNGPMPVVMTHQSRHALVDAVKQSAVIDRLELVAEVERLAAQTVWPVDERTEIRHGWLVESGYPGDFIGGYGMVPDSDAMPLVCLDTIPGYPDLATAEAEANQLRADLRTLAQQVEKVRALHQPWDDGPQPYCTHDREPWPCPTELALGAR